MAYACDSEEIHGRTRFQKMIFLMEHDMRRRRRRKGGGKAEEGGMPMPNLGFVPFDYGPYSKTLQQDVDTLVEEGRLSEERGDPSSGGRVMYTYAITREGKRIAKMLVSDPRYAEFRFGEAYEELEKIKEKFNGMGLPDLLKHVYGAYPEYASLSKYDLW